jgi:opacity protein-like surface antigen
VQRLKLRQGRKRIRLSFYLSVEITRRKLNERTFKKHYESRNYEFVKMKKTIFMIIFMFLLFLSSLLSQENKLQVTAARAYIYADPSIDSSIVETVVKGTVLNQISPGKIQFVWYRVSYYSKKRSNVIIGYIQTSSVEIIGGAPQISREERQKPKIKRKNPPVISAPLQRKTYAPKKFKIGPISGLGFLAGYAMPAASNYSNGLNYGGNICLGITKNLSIELKGLRFQSDVEGDPEALSKGKLSVMPIQLSIQLRLPVTGRFLPYLLGGGGYYLNRFNIDEEITDAWDALGFDLEEKAENAIGYHFGAGIDLFITKNIALNADIRYCLAKIKCSWTLTDQIIGTKTSGDIEDLNLNSLIFGGGLKFYF